MSNSYVRIDYTKTDGTPSSAYRQPETGEAYDVWNQKPVTLVTGPDGTFWEQNLVTPKPTANVSRETKPTATKKKKKKVPRQVTLVPKFYWWQPVILAIMGLCLIWLETQFPGYLTGN